MGGHFDLRNGTGVLGVYFCLRKKLRLNEIGPIPKLRACFRIDRRYGPRLRFRSLFFFTLSEYPAGRRRPFTGVLCLDLLERRRLPYFGRWPECQFD
jgi:hypothetical protein